MDDKDIKKKQSEKETPPEATKKGFPRWAKVLISIILLDVVGGGLWFFVFSPQAKMKLAVKEMAAAAEKKDAKAILEHFSEDYYDEGGNTKAIFAQFLDFAFGMSDKISISIEEVKVQTKGPEGAVAVKGYIHARFKDVPTKYDYTKNPVGLAFRKEAGGWKVIAIAGMDFSMSENMDNIKNDNIF